MRKKLLYIGGFISLLYVIVHASFWKLFNWNEELAKLSTMNKGLMVMLDIGIGYLLIFVVIISVYLAKFKKLGFLEKAIIVFIAGIYLLRFAFGFPLFGFTMLELMNGILCIIAASCYFLALRNPQT
jgi:hypothetical protein